MPDPSDPSAEAPAVSMAWRRQPIHTVYGGAHLFTAQTCQKLGQLAQRSLAQYAGDSSLFAAALGIPAHLAQPVYDRVAEKLRREAVEDFRIDFEDGFGIRSDAEEDAAAENAARETARAMDAGGLPPFFGIRVKPLSDDLGNRARRTLGLYLKTLLHETRGQLPPHFVVTLPKIAAPEEVFELSDALRAYERIGIEIMVETPQALFILPHLVAAGRGLCVAAHFGAYDYTSSLGITAAAQSLRHSACDFARNMMLAGLASTGVWLSDGATNLLPLPPHRDAALTAAQTDENTQAVHAAWKLHYDQVRHALVNGFYQGWDLHPAQLPARYASVYTFFMEGMQATSARLKNFVAVAAQATHVRGVFDDAATGQGLLNYFLRAVNCGAILESEVPELTALTLGELRTGSFTKIARQRAEVR